MGMVVMSVVIDVQATIDSGFVIQALQIYAGRTDYKKQYYATGTIDYSSGGVTFNYPSGLFAQPPQVIVTIQLKNLGFSAARAITPIVTSNSASQTVVRVLAGTLITLGEAATNDVSVNLLAIGS
jgi:hypothetical protein